MNLNFRTLAALCSVAVSLNSGCNNIEDRSSQGTGAVSPLLSSDMQEAGIAPACAEDADFTPATHPGCTISFYEDSIGIRGEGAEVSGSSAVISTGGVYSVSGECSDGQLVIDCAEPVSLIVEGLTLSSGAGAVIECTEKATLLTLSLSDENYISGEVGILSGADVTINGTGSLEISGENALRCDVLKLCGAELSISTRGDAVIAENSIIAAAGDALIYSKGDGIHTDGYVSISGGSFDITSGNNGIYANSAVFISGGDLRMVCGGGSYAVRHMKGGRFPSAKHGGFSTDGNTNFDFSNLVSGDGSTVCSKKGIKTGGSVEISGGSVDISSADDCINARTDIVINDGALSLSSGDDAIHADKNMFINGGDISVAASYTAVEGMNIEINGGTVDITSYYDGIAVAGGNGAAVNKGQNNTADRNIGISGGVVTIDAGGDGIDSTGTASITGGIVSVFSANNSNFGAVVYSDSFVLSGGVLAAFGSAEKTMAPTLVAGPCISVCAEISAGSRVQLADNAGNAIVDVIVLSDCSAAIFSSEQIKSGSAYSLFCDGVKIDEIIAVDGISGGGPDSGGAGNYEYVDGFDSNHIVA